MLAVHVARRGGLNVRKFGIDRLRMFVLPGHRESVLVPNAGLRYHTRRAFEAAIRSIDVGLLHVHLY